MLYNNTQVRNRFNTARSRRVLGRAKGVQWKNRLRTQS